DALKLHIRTRLQAIADKYFARAISAQVTIGKGPHDNGFTCDIVAHVMQGVILKGRNAGMDAHVAYDGAADRIEKQLRRYVRRLKDRATPPAPAAATENEPSALDGVDDDRFYNARYTLFSEADEDSEPSDAPVIIAETRVDVPQATVSDAVMMLDLRNTAALLFLNSGTGAYNMVYRRGDGTIGWVEPQRSR
ncbi:MAG: ribosome hibernation promotion factor, partial [Sphingomonas sp.]